MKTKQLLKRIMLSMLFLAATLTAAAQTATGTMDIGGTTAIDLTQDASGAGWTWTADNSTLDLASTYTGEAIAINCQWNDQINLVYTGDITISSDTEDAIYCRGALTMNGSGGTLSLSYTGEEYMYSAITSIRLLTISSGDISAECAATSEMNGSTISGGNACAIYAEYGLSITGNASITMNNTGANAHGFFAGNAGSEISTTGTITVNATGAGYAMDIGTSLTISNGSIHLSNADNPENMIQYSNGLVMTGGTITYNGGTAPVLTDITPGSGTFGIEAVLVGQNLSEVKRIQVNGKRSIAFSSDNDSQVTFTVPAGEVGSGSIAVETAEGIACLVDGFTYTNDSYRVTMISGDGFMGFPCGFLDTEAGAITKPNNPASIKNAWPGSTGLFSGGWYKNRNCTTEWDFDTDIVDKDMNIYARYAVLVTPEDDADDVPVNVTVSASFMSLVTENDLSGITISPDPGNVSASLIGRELTIAHNDFAPNTTYTVTIPAGATSINTVDLIWSFTTAATPVLSSDATLATLTVSEGTLSPAFSADEANYSISVENEVEEIIISATATDDENANITGTGNQTLVVGSNPFDITVTAEDGTTKTYTVTVTREHPTGIEDVTAAEMKIYQSNGVLYIESPEYIKNIRLNNIDGSLVFKQENVGNTINIQALPKGVYLLTLVTSKGETVRKIVKE